MTQKFGPMDLYFTNLQKWLQRAYKSSFVWIPWTRTENMVHRGHFSHVYTHLSVPTICVLTRFRGLILNYCGENSQTLQNSQFFAYILQSKINWKNRRKWKFCLHNFMANIVMHFQAKYWTGRMKIDGAHSIWKKRLTDRRIDGRRKARHWISTTDYDYVSSESNMKRDV